MTEQRPILRIESLHLAYDGPDVLRDVNLSVRRSELVFIIGPSGSGKSSLLRCCNRLEDPQRGRIFVDDAEITARGADLNRLRQGIGMVFQSFNLYPHLDALGNVSLALRKVQRMPRPEAEARAMETLASVGLADRAGSFPHQLSGGQQQRVAIARALALRPKIMLFDEPTSALDPELVGDVLGVMRQLKDDGMTMLVVSHEMRFARDAADRVVFMDQGAIVETGPPEQIFVAPVHRRTSDFVQRIGR